jgi:hypothetical protein
MKYPALLLAALCFADAATAQTLEQSIAFVLSSGVTEPLQIKQIDDSTVSAPAVFQLGGIMSEAFLLKTLDAKNCLFQQQATGLTQNWFFNNVTEVSVQYSAVTLNGGVRSDVYTMKLIGEKSVKCRVPDTVGSDCDTAPIIPIYPTTLDRMKKALDYIYDKHCTLAQRKSAF